MRANCIRSPCINQNPAIMEGGRYLMVVILETYLEPIKKSMMGQHYKNSQ